MRFESPVGPEILAPLGATRHPGYVTCPRRELPYERRPESAAFVPFGAGSVYYSGAFVGGLRDAFLDLSARISGGIDRDAAGGIVARWHDESHLNRCLIDTPPFQNLSPGYCYPDDDRPYRPLWREPYPRRLVTLDKPRAGLH
jgi:Glycosyltransferase family 6